VEDRDVYLILLDSNIDQKIHKVTDSMEQDPS